MKIEKAVKGIDSVAGDVAGAALGLGAIYMIAQMWLKPARPKPPTVAITQPSGETIDVPLIPEDYHDQSYYVEQGLVEPPTQVSYNQNLIQQPAELEGVTWQSGSVNEALREEMAAEAAAAQADARRREAERRRQEAVAAAQAAADAAEQAAHAAAAAAHGTGLTQNQQVMSQPGRSEGVTWQSGVRPQDRPDRG